MEKFYKHKNIFDGTYKSPPKELLETEIKKTKDNYIYYYSLFFSNIIYDTKIGNFSVYKGIMLEYDNSATNEDKTFLVNIPLNYFIK